MMNLARVGLTMALMLATASAALGAEKKAETSGDWKDAKTWGGAVPAEGDSVVVADGVTVTVSDARAAGASGATGTVAIELGKTGALVIAKGGVLRVRGDVVYTGGAAATSAAVTVQGGGTWRWDSSKAPAGTSYVFRPSSDQGFRAFVLEGTAETRAVLDSDSAGTPGRFTRGGKNFAGPFKARFANITRIGDEKTAGWDIFWHGNGGNKGVTWDVQDSNFVSCGAISIIGGVEAEGVFRHNRNSHVGSVGLVIFSSLPGRGGPIGRGVREIHQNVFDVAAAVNAFVEDLTITGNYCGGGFAVFHSSEPCAKYEGNFNRIFGQFCWTTSKRFADSVIFIDRDWDNPHVVFGSTKYDVEIDGLILSHAGTANMDSGEWIFCTNGWKRCIFLPNHYGYSSGEMTATGGGAKAAWVIEHNTWFGGYGGMPKGKSAPGFSAFQYSESGNSQPGTLKSFRSNLLWNPMLSGKESAFVKLCDVHSLYKDQKDGPPIENVGDPKNIDFNASWNMHKDQDIDFPNKDHFKNWGKGYIGNWSRTPGEHDLDVDPQFVDYRRDVQLFATKCLGKTASRGDWKNGEAYKAGDTVLHKTEILWGLPVMYRYIGSGENPEPGKGTRAKGDEGQWRKSWEWASLHYLREGVRTGQKFGEDDVIMHLIKWIRAGYAPTNPLLKGAAHDGGDIGAVPWEKKQ